MASWIRVISRTWPAGLLLFPFLITSCAAKMMVQGLKDLEGFQMKEMLKHQIKEEEEKGQRRRGARMYTNETTPDQKNVDPYMRPGIVNDVLRTYSRYHEMIKVNGGSFWMGTNDPQSRTGEYPLRRISVKTFYLDSNPVINADFWAFRKVKKFYRTEAEKKGWSWVVNMFLSNETRQYYSMPGSTGWAAVKKSYWGAPEGPDSNLDDRWKHPVVHVSWYDAKLFCEYHGKRLPTESEWEHAVKIGVTSHQYPWGDKWERRRANLWQGNWPAENKKVDGYSITSPVDAFRPQNLVGFYDMIGNVWEWTSSAYVEMMARPLLQTTLVVLKGGSFVDSVSGNVNYVVRNGQRMGQKQDYTAANVGFRCAKNVPEDVKPVLQKVTPADTKGKPPKRRRKFHRRRRDEL